MNREELSIIRAMFDAFVDPLLLLDSSGQVVRLNANAAKLFGTKGQGRNIDHVIRLPQLLSAVELALKGETPPQMEITLPREIDYTYAVSIQPLFFNTKAGTPRVMITLHDITALRRSEQLRVDFLANASHELKTPLASLIGFIETLQGPAKDDAEAREKFLDIMHAQASRMGRLVQDLLSLARIEFSEHVTPDGAVDLMVLAQQSILQLESKAAERGITLVLHAEPNLPAVKGDADQLMQLLQNLIDNAIKYTSDQTAIDITLTLDKAEDQMRLIVRDHGPGIEREHLSRLTERFYRIDSGRSRKAGGTGLGLSIVKHIISRHRGKLLIESEIGSGSTFTALLPLAEKPA